MSGRMPSLSLEQSCRSIIVISFGRKKIFSRYSLHKPASLRAIRNGTCWNKDSDRHTMRIHDQMYFCVEPTLCTAHILIASYRSCGMRMNLAVACIYHEPFKIRFNDDHFRNLLPNPAISPATKSTMSIFPVSIIRRQISPRRSCANYPENNVKKASIVAGSYAPRALLPRMIFLKAFKLCLICHDDDVRTAYPSPFIKENSCILQKLKVN